VTIYGDVFAALDAVDVRYVVVGGLAVILHGRVRSTVDLDLVIDLAAEPARRAMVALTDLGLRPRIPVDATDFADPAKRQDWLENKHMRVFSFFDPSNALREIDVFVDYPLDMEALLRDAATVLVDGHPVQIASVQHLIQMKLDAGRPRDLDDVAMLREIVGDV
jgi:hypothetical protein